MRKTILLVAVIIGLISCEEKEISLYPNFEESATFRIDTDGFEKKAVINASRISSAVNDAVDDEGAIERIVLEGIWFELSPNKANTASKLTIDFGIQSWDTDVYLPILDDFEFEIKEGKLVFLKHLQAAGVNELKKQINAIAKGSVGGDLVFKAEGVVSPEGSTVDVDVEVFINATVIYTSTVTI